MPASLYKTLQIFLWPKLKINQQHYLMIKLTNYSSIALLMMLKKSAALSMAGTVKNTIKTRKIGFIMADGVETKAVKELKAKLEKEGAVVEIIAASMAPVIANDKSTFIPNHSLTSTASVCFDALYVCAGKKSADILMNAENQPGTLLFVNEAYKHCKAIAFGKDTTVIFNASNISSKKHKDPAVIKEMENGFENKFINAIANHRVWELEDERNNPA